MYSPTLWIILFYYVPLFLFLIFSVFFYFRAIKHSGLERLRKFTAIMLAAIACIVVLAFFRYDIWDLLEFVPFRAWGAISNNYIRLTVVFGLIIYGLISIKLIRNEKTTRFLQIAWLLIVVSNIASIAFNTYKYFTWKAPAPDPNASWASQVIIEHVMTPHIYIRSMFIPISWIVVSTISFLKIRKETQRNLAVA